MKLKPEIKTILEKDEISVCEAGSILRAVVSMFDASQKSILETVSYTKDDLTALVNACSATLHKADEYYTELDTIQGKVFDKAEKVYKDIIAAHNTLLKRVESLPKIEPAYIPYNTKEIIDIAERLSHLSDEQWGRVIDLAKAFAK